MCGKQDYAEDKSSWWKQQDSNLHPCSRIDFVIARPIELCFQIICYVDLQQMMTTERSVGHTTHDRTYELQFGTFVPWWKQQDSNLYFTHKFCDCSAD